MLIRSTRIALALLLPGLSVLAACSSPTPKTKFQDELFSNEASPYMHSFDVPSAEACESARRALLSQGYMTTLARPDTIDATKNFQPASDSHFVVEFHVVCTAGDDATNSSVVYANAVQNGYALKKSDTSASVGLSVLGSLSLPIRSNSDAMVKISSETIQAGKFYDRFFDLVGRYLQNAVRSAPVPGEAVEAKPLPLPVAPVAPAQVVAPVPVSAHAAAQGAMPAAIMPAPAPMPNPAGNTAASPAAGSTANLPVNQPVNQPANPIASPAANPVQDDALDAFA
ncbi:MAG TPA: DUF2242 domain-containing protein, partial [Paraburkholderia sp.]|nr:DUF2242 domain-containing protein [Paraburkholderia sp.]